MRLKKIANKKCQIKKQKNGKEKKIKNNKIYFCFNQNLRAIF